MFRLKSLNPHKLGNRHDRKHSNTFPSHFFQETETQEIHGGSHPQASKGRKFLGPTAQATGGARPPPPPSTPRPRFSVFRQRFPTPWGPAITHHPRPRAAPARGTQTRGLCPPHRAAATPPPHGPPARAARPFGQEVASPHAGRGGEGTHVSARRPGPRPLGCGSALTASGSALLGAGSSRRGFPPGPGTGVQGGKLGRGRGKGLGKEGEEGEKRREPNPEREKRGEGGN